MKVRNGRLVDDKEKWVTIRTLAFMTLMFALVTIPLTFKTIEFLKSMLAVFG